MSVLPWRRALPPAEPPDFVAQGMKAEAAAALAAERALYRPEGFASVLAALRDPYGLDPVVFGSEPRVSAG